MMTKTQMATLMREVFEAEIMALREAGQKEYSHNDGNALANFERTGEDLNIDRKLVLWIFAMKHRDGIASYLKGHRSQREDVRGRINDLIVYLFLLRGMIDDEARSPLPTEVSSAKPQPDSVSSTHSVSDSRKANSVP